MSDPRHPFHLLAVVPALLMTVPGTRAEAASGNGTATVTTISPLAIANTADLDFGTMLPSAAGGTVTVNAQSAARTSAGVTLAGGTVSTGNFIGAATPGRVVTISAAPAPTITLNRVGGGATMTVNQIRVSVDGGTPQPFGPNHIVGPSGAILFRIGGRLNVGAAQMEGVYQANFTLSMDYQ